MDLVLWIFSIVIAFFIGIFINLKLYDKRSKKVDGVLVVMEEDTSKIYQLEITTSPDKLSKQDLIVLKVSKVPKSISSSVADENPEDIPPEWAGM